VKSLKRNPILSLINSYVIDSPSPLNLSYLWNYGSLLGVCLIIQIISGVTLAMHVRCVYVLQSRTDLLFARYFYTSVTSELGIRESLILNIASLIKVVQFLKQLTEMVLRVIFSMVKVILLQVYYPLLLSYGVCPNCTWTYISTRDIGAWSRREVGNAGLEIIQLKGKSRPSKESERTVSTITGLPNGSNSYGNGAIIVPIGDINPIYAFLNRNGRGRVAALLLFRRSYGTIGTRNSEFDVGSKLNKLNIRAYKNVIIKEKLYSLLYNVNTLIYAYNNIKSNPGNMTQGITPETLDGVSLKTFEEISFKLKSEQFKFTPSRRIRILKASGGTRPLSIATPRDKIVQEAMRLILQAIYEPMFLDCSHGFRPNRSCHTALKDIYTNFQPVTWVIEGDISNCFDSINHQKLMKLIESRIADRQFTKLIWKSLTAGYFEFTQYKSNIVGTPQGSIISPILANIFLNQLDNFIENLKINFDKGVKPKRTKESRYFEYHILKARKNGDHKLAQELIVERSKNPATDYFDPDYKRLCYVRYADDWVIGIRGSHQETLQILEKVNNFSSELGLNVSETKTRITNLNLESALFLGTKIFRSNHRRFSRIGNTRFLKRIKLSLRFEAPLDRIKKKLSEASFLKNGKASPKFLWIHNDHNQIIFLYNSVLRGYLNYYSFVHNYGRLTSYLTFKLKQSCAKLLATKYTLGTTAKVFSKFGKNLAGPNQKGFMNPSYKLSLKFKTNIYPIVGALFQVKTNSTFENLSCKICGSTYRIEFHHVRAMKDLNPKVSYMDKLMIKANRKQIPLCRECHMLKHRKNSIL